MIYFLIFPFSIGSVSSSNFYFNLKIGSVECFISSAVVIWSINVWLIKFTLLGLTDKYDYTISYDILSLRLNVFDIIVDTSISKSTRSEFFNGFNPSFS